MIHQIQYVDDSVSNNTSLGVLNITIIKRYVEGLEPRHRAHSHHKRLHILDYTFEATNNEVNNITEESLADVGNAFITVNSYFVWVPELKSSYIFITISLILKSCVFTDGKSYFVSKYTTEECRDLVPPASPKTSLHLMDFCIYFE